MINNLIEQFVTLFVVIDPIGTVPVFVAATAGIAARERPKVALQAAVFAFLVLMLFLIGGQVLFDAMKISLPAFQIAGGLILFLFALTMIFGESKPETEVEGVEKSKEKASPAVFPLAVPSLASPGAMLSIVLLTDNNRFSVEQQVVTAGLMLLVIAIAFVLMLSAGPILRVIRLSGAAIVSRVSGMILASVAVENVINAVIELLRTTKL